MGAESAVGESQTASVFRDQDVDPDDVYGSVFGDIRDFRLWNELRGTGRGSDPGDSSKPGDEDGKKFVR